MDYSVPADQYYYSNYFFPSESYNFPTVPSGIAMCNGENLPFLNNNEELNMLLPLMSSDINSPISSTEQLGVSDVALPNGYGGFCDFGAAGGAFEARYQHELCEGSSGCSALMPDNLCRAYPGVGENFWGIQGKPATNVEETAIKVGRYSIEERKDRILRYLKKRNQRNFNKTIKYACRKTLADKRVRVRGRFAKNNEPSEHENEKKTSNNYWEENNTCYDDSIQIKYDDEEDNWLEAAMSSLMYFPYISS